MGGRLDGKIAIVTGGSQGIGRGIALALASEGAAVTVTGRTRRHRPAGGRCRGQGGDPRPHQGRGPRVGRYGVRVNVICPAALSPAAESFRDSHPERFAAVIGETPLGRLGPPGRGH